GWWVGEWGGVRVGCAAGWCVGGGAGWWLVVVVCGGAGEQPDGGFSIGLRRSGWHGAGRLFFARKLVLGSGGVRGFQLLDRLSTGTGIIAAGKVATPRRVSLPGVPGITADGEFLAVQPMWKRIRHFPVTG